MDDTVITTKGLRKVYKLYRKPMDRLREILFHKQYHNEFIALDGIDINVRKGETLGIIGENGAGKSTLLKIVARTLKPTDGEVNIKGKVSSLLELGSGFHPEFTGIDNIYFYGSLTGISHEEMREKIREIISFAEIGEHINYPLRTYSSGMYVRLAFSVATAIDPDILVIDEALSVGDLHFQKKSTDRIMSFKEDGKTIVFCSHNMYHVTRLCDRVLWFKNGRIYMEDSAFEVVQAYETYQLEKDNDLTNERSITSALEAPAVSDVPVDKEKKHIFIKDIQLSPFQNIRTGSDLTVKIKIVAENDRLPYRIAVKIRRVDGLDIVGIGTKDYEPFKGDRTIGIRFPDIQLREGTFFIEAFAFDENFVHIFDLKSSEPFVVPKESLELGIVRLPYEWLIN